MAPLFRKKFEPTQMLAPDDPYYVEHATTGKGSFRAPAFDYRFVEDDERDVFSDRKGRTGQLPSGGVKKLLPFGWGKKPAKLTVTSAARPLSPSNLPPLPPSPVTPIAAKFSTNGLGAYPGSPSSPSSPGDVAFRHSTLAKFPAPPQSLPSMGSALTSSSSNSTPSRVNLPTRRSSLVGVPRHVAANDSVSTVSTFQTTSSFASSKLFHSSVDEHYDSSSDATTMSSISSSPESYPKIEGRRMWKVKGLQESPLRPEQVIPPSQQARRDDTLRPPCEEDEDEYVRTASSRRNSTPVPGFMAALLGVEPETPPRPKRWSASSNKPAHDSPPFDLAREKAAWRASQHGYTGEEKLVPESPNGSSDDADDEVSPPRSRAVLASNLQRSRIPSIRFEGISMDAMFAEVEKNMQTSGPSAPTSGASLLPTIEVAEGSDEDEDVAARQERKGARRRTRVISAYRPASGYFNVKEDESTLSPTPDEMDVLRGEPVAEAPGSRESAVPARLDIARPRPGPRRNQPRPSRLNVDLANSLPTFDRMGSVTPTSAASTVMPYGGVASPDEVSVFSAATSESSEARDSIDLFSPVESEATTPQQPNFALSSPPRTISPSPSLTEPYSPMLSPSPSLKSMQNAQEMPLVEENPVEVATATLVEAYIEIPAPPSPTPRPSPPPTRPAIPSVFVFPPSGPAYRRGESSDWEGAPPKPPANPGPAKIIVVQPKRMFRASTRPVSSLPKRDVTRQRIVVTPYEPSEPAPLSPTLSSTSTVHAQRPGSPASPAGWSFPARERMSSVRSARSSTELSVRPSSFGGTDSGSDYDDPLQTMLCRLNAPHTPPRVRTVSGPSSTRPSSGLTASALLRHTSSQTHLSMLEREMGGMSASSSTNSFKGGPKILVTAPHDEEEEQVDENVPIHADQLIRVASKSSSSSAGSTNVETIITTYESDDSGSRYGDAPLRVNVAPSLVPAIVEPTHVAVSEHAHSTSGSSSASSSCSVAESPIDDVHHKFCDESSIESESDEVDLMSREIERTLASIEESVSSSSSSLASAAKGHTARSASISSIASSVVLAYASEPASSSSLASALPPRMTPSSSHTRNWSDASCSTMMTDSTECSSSSNSSDERHAEIAVVMTGHRVSCSQGVGVIGQAM